MEPKYTAAKPSLQSLCAPREEGWQNYFRYGTVTKAYQAVNFYV